MTTSLLSIGEAGRPLSLGRVALAGARLLFALFAAYAIYTTRRAERFDTGVALSLGVFVGLYLIFGRRGGLRPISLYIIATGLFTQGRLLADETGISVQYEYVASMERAMFGAIPSAWLQERLYETGQAAPWSLYAMLIYFSYFASFPVGALVMWLRYRAFFPTYAVAMVTASYIGLLVSVVLPTAPPWLAAGQGYVPEVHRIVEEVTATVDSGAYGGGASFAGVNQVAAMPSLHMALTVIVMLTVWRLTRNRAARALSVLYAGSMAFALVYLGEHYVIDEVFGVLTAVAAWQLALKLTSSADARLWRLPLPRRRATAGSPSRATPLS